MKNKKTILIALGSIALAIALFIGSYVIRQNQFQAISPVSAMLNNEDVDLTTAENETADDEVVDEIGNGSALSAEPSAKLDKMYEEAMANSDLQAFEIELIRSMVGKENKTFEEALQAVRPGSKIIQEQTETQTAGNNQNTQPATPTKPSGNDPSSAGSSNSDNRTEAQKKAEQDALDKWGGGKPSKSGDTSHAPDFGNYNNPDNRTDAQKKADDDAISDWGGGKPSKSGDTSHEPDFGLPDNRTDQQKQSEDPSSDPFNPGRGGNSNPVDHEPDL